MKRCVIVGGSYIGNYNFVREHLCDDDFVIYCDCGLSHMEGLKEAPSLIVGDFDSHENPNLDVETIVLPTEKDDTDTVYAVKEAINRGFTEFVLVGVLGKRMDHTLGNLAILLMLDSKGLSGVIVDDYSEIRVVSGDSGDKCSEICMVSGDNGDKHSEIRVVSGDNGDGNSEIHEASGDNGDKCSEIHVASGDNGDDNSGICVVSGGRNTSEAGSIASCKESGSLKVSDSCKGSDSLKVSDSCKYFSVLAAGGDASGVTIKNAKYNITDADLTSDFPLGVSNEVPAGNVAEVSVKKGRLFVIEVFGE